MHTSRRRSNDTFDNYGYKIDFINGEVGRGRRKRLLVAWKDFGPRGDTLEPVESIYPKTKLLKYEACIASVHVLGLQLNDLRESLARRLTSRRIGERVACWRLPLEVPRIT